MSFNSDKSDQAPTAPSVDATTLKRPAPSEFGGSQMKKPQTKSDATGCSTSGVETQNGTAASDSIEQVADDTNSNSQMTIGTSNSQVTIGTKDFNSFGTSPGAYLACKWELSACMTDRY